MAARRKRKEMISVEFDPVSYINEQRWQGSILGLERISALLEGLGRPQDRLRFVHVAGTNGKGSTCAYLASVLQAAGYKTGLFTSPFIEVFEERIRIDGKNISREELVESTFAVRDVAEALADETGDHPTEFELMTAVALEYFARQACDIVVLEVGLGGRLDSTNVIDAPEVSVIARIGLDHTKTLGNTLAAIAGEKAGIVKAGVPVVSWPQEPEAMAVIECTATTCGSELRVMDLSQVNVCSVQRCTPGDYVSAGSAADAVFEEIVRPFAYREYVDMTTSLLGSYQPANAALVIETIEALRSREWTIPDEAVRAGIAATRWPGRFEVLPRVPGEPTVVVDGGHNPQGAVALVESLTDVFPGAKPVFILGVLEDKDYPVMLESVLPMGSAFVTVTPPNPRALPAFKLARAIRWTGQDLLGCSACMKPYEARDFDDAMMKARQEAGPSGIICAFGSLYSIAEIKRAWRSRSS